MSSSEAVKIKHSAGHSQPKEAYFNLPNSLTLSRILLIPVFVYLFSDPTEERTVAAAFVFAVAALTDLLDGYVARRRGQITNLGKLLDPVADKLLVAAGLVLLVQFQRVGVWLVIAIIAREIIVTGARAVAAREGFIVAADSLGKVKVVSQISGIIALILQDVIALPLVSLHELGTWLLWAALFFAVVSGAKYIVEVLRKVGPQYL
ncbi:MAG: CDP-diacylglycerol--glycerol-3-phosphate 3-phosphatidyltransferase [Nitrospirales bacterium]|nr:MAG: CDP-diacylglycerol--glycerol-3-phosphate 3-phosphatidyltransferase [Nitrospirales bacterium]